jgi:small subunit ribosomal protein S13
MAEEATRKIVRLLSTDIDGNLTVGRALRKVKGISFMFSKAVCTSSGIEYRKKLGLLSMDEIKKLETYIQSPKMPFWMLNRRNDMDTGADIHITGSEILLKRREDINLMRKSRSYKGVRHELGLPVRGQRTRSSFRSQKTVGVVKKKAMPGKAPSPAPAKQEKK